MASLIVAVVTILFLDGLVSASEAAVFSVPLFRARLLAKKSKLGKTLLSLKESMEFPITTLVSLSNLITIVGSVLTGLIAADVFGEEWVGAFAAVLTFLIMIFAEIIPKRLGERFAEPIGLAVAVPLFFISRLFSPITWFIRKCTEPFGRGKKSITSEEEIAFLVTMGTEEGAIRKHEGEFINRVFKLNDITAYDMMTPAMSATLLNAKDTVLAAKETIQNASHSRIPVWSESPDHVIGIAHQRELLRALVEGRNELLVEDFVQPALIVRDTRLGDELLRDFKEKRQHMAIVTNRDGRLVGVVGLSDVLEELIGEVIEEQEVSPELIKRVSRYEVVAHGKTALPFLNYFFNLDLQGASTLNDFLRITLGHLPRTGEIIEDAAQQLKFVVEEATTRGAKKVRITKPNTPL